MKKILSFLITELVILVIKAILILPIAIILGLVTMLISYGFIIGFAITYLILMVVMAFCDNY